MCRDSFPCGLLGIDEKIVYITPTANQRHTATGPVSEAAFETRSPMNVRKVLSGQSF